MKRLIVLPVAALILALGLMLAGGQEAHSDACTGSWSIGVGGMTFGAQGTFQTSGYLVANRLVAHNSIDPGNGIGELDRMFWAHRGECPADHIKLLGHSEGALVVDLWLGQHPGIENVNAILLARPGGFSVNSGVSVLSICRQNDSVCNPAVDAYGYLFLAAHTSYDYSAFDYGDNDSGFIWLPATG